MSKTRASKLKRGELIALLRSWGVPAGAKLRYNGLKGIYWYYFSQFIRKRDCERFGTCVSCNRKIDDWRTGHAGHFVSAGEGGFRLLFDPMNVHLQCAKCNNPTFTPDAGIGYAITLDKRYGYGTAESLWARKGITTPEWTEEIYTHKLAELGIKQIIVETNAEH